MREVSLAADFGAFALAGQRIAIGFDYAYTRYEYGGIASRDRDLHRLQLPLSWAGERGDWQVRMLAAPGVATSSNVFKEFWRRGSGEDYFLTGSLDAKRPVSASVAVSLGAGFDRSFGEPRWYPALGLALTPSDRLTLTLGWPKTEAVFSATDRHSFKLNIEPAGHEWHVVTDDFASTFPYRSEAWRGQLSWRVALTDAVWLDVAGGIDVAQSLDFRDDAGARVNRDVDDATFFRLGIGYGRID